MRLAGHVAQMVKRRGAYTGFLVMKSFGKALIGLIRLRIGTGGGLL